MMRERLDELDRLWKTVNHAMIDTIRQTVQSQSLPIQFMGVMRELLRGPGATVSELARSTEMAKSHVSKTVDRLVELGLAEKQPDPKDRRLVRVYATGQAREQFRQMHSHVLAKWAVVVSTISEEEIDALLHGLRALEKALQDLSPARPEEVM